MYYTYNEAQTAPELVQGPPAMQAKSCAAMALLPRVGSRGGKVRQKGWKKADPFQQQQEVSGSAVAFLHPPLQAALLLPDPALLSLPSPGIAGETGSTRAGALLCRSKGGEGKGQLWRHPTRAATAGVS